MGRSTATSILYLTGTCLFIAVLGRPGRADSPGVQDSTATRAQSGRRIPFELTGNRIALDVRVNGSEPLSFVLDTGASATILDTDQAAQLGLQLESISGANAPADLRRANGVSLRLPGVDLVEQAILVRDLDSAQLLHSGRHLHGVLGYDFFRQFVVEIDYVSKVLTLFDPTTYEYRGTGESIPLQLLRVPFALAKITTVGTDAVERLLFIDSGSDATVNYETEQVPSKTIEQEQVDLSNNITSTITATFGRAKSVQLGSFVIADPVVGLQHEFTIPGFLRTTKGIVGGGLLRRFRVIFDYEHKRMILEPNPHLHDPFEFDMSGAWVISDKPNSNGFRITSVMPNAPALEAGLHVGDVIVAVDGQAAEELTVERLTIEIFRQEGRILELKVKRGNEMLQTRLNLRRLI
jgi:aspartyl protease/PDZ domain-containing protein